MTKRKEYIKPQGPFRKPTLVQSSHFPKWMLLLLPMLLLSCLCSSQVLDSPEIPPTFPGGMEAFYEHVNQQLKYPERALAAGTVGKVFLQFVVETSGEVSGVKVVKGISPECDQEAIRVLTQAPDFIPGHQEGKPVRSRMILPVLFTLSGDVSEGESTQEYEPVARSLETVLANPKANHLVLKFRQLIALEPTIGQAIQLRYLDLTGNNLEELPPEIGALKNLVALHLTYNELTELPATISQLESLQTLYLDRNDLKAFPGALLDLPQLKTLDISYTQIKELPKQVAEMPNLKVIYARGTLINTNQIQQIQTLNPNLEILK